VAVQHAVAVAAAAAAAVAAAAVAAAAVAAAAVAAAAVAAAAALLTKICGGGIAYPPPPSLEAVVETTATI
jgi:hypothetical protein